VTDTTTQTSGDEYDPFAVFDEATGAGAVVDPYPVFAELRAECPVHAGGYEDKFGPVAGVDPALLNQGPQFTPLSFEAVQAVLKDGETFSSSAYADSMGLVMGHSILEMDEPEHHRYRSLIAQAFTRKAMERWEAELVRPIVHGLIDEFAGEGHAELVRQLFWPFPVHVIAGMLGLPAEELPQFHRKAVELISIGFDIERGLEASQWLYDFFAGVIAERRQRPRGDVISVLAEAELEGQRLTDEEIIAFLRLLLPAGAETTYRSSSNLMSGFSPGPSSSPHSAPTGRSCRSRSRRDSAGSRRSPGSAAPRSVTSSSRASRSRPAHRSTCASAARTATRHGGSGPTTST